MSEIQNDVCPMFGDRCRHLSIEKTSRPYTELQKDPSTKLFKPLRAGRKVVIIGEFCNDAGKWVADMHYCPVKYSLANPIKEAAVKKKHSRRCY